ncbi:MAG: RNA-binding transcriptional accessory protein [Natronospirillum sp.]
MDTQILSRISQQIANELAVDRRQVVATMQLLQEGATVPFIARYRKEVTGALDDTQLRNLEERLRYLTELEDRRGAILKSVDEQGKLTPELSAALNSAATKTELEDLYLPYKVKRRTKGQIAIEAGLEPLANTLLENPDQDPEQVAADYVNADLGVADVKAALEGAKYILMERFAEQPSLVGELRQFLQEKGQVHATLVPGKEQEGAKFADYFDHHEAWKNMPSHRALAVFRGRNEGVLQMNLQLDADAYAADHAEGMIALHLNVPVTGRAASAWLKEVVRWTWRVKLLPHLETDLFGTLRERAEEDAIKVFGRNLKDLMLAAPAGPRVTLGMDPAYRTGVKLAVVDKTGKVLDHDAVYPHQPQNRWDEAKRVVVALCKKHGVELIAIGNGTASRETDKLATEIAREYPELKLNTLMVSEAGASVYSASDFAAREFPDLDVTIRGAISIARRLQDPLAELVKIDPKAIGVGQYQHDVSQVALARSLETIVEDCVNAVGVDLNTASVPLLSRVSGLNTTIASNIVAFRDSQGRFEDRRQLKDVPRLGPKAFEQCAGFLKVANGRNPLDASAVHPESYSVVEKIVASTQRPVTSLIGDSAFLRQLDPVAYTDERFGLPTVKDILSELEKPGRDPRPEFKTATFKEGVEKVGDLRPGMVLEGVVTNVTNFGAFVDVGVHQDGLVHISAMSHQFIKDPAEVAKAGDVVQVKVMDVDVPRQRIALSMRLDDEPGKAEPQRAGGRPNRAEGQRASKGAPRAQAPAPAANGTMGALLQQALKNAKK